MNRMCLFLITAILLCSLPSSLKAKVADTVDANNPLASIKSVSVHNIYTPSFYSAEGMMNTTWIRYAQPIGRVLIRVSLPINTVKLDDNVKSGLGELNMFATYVVTNPSSRYQFGFGPFVSFPTATAPILGTGKWQAGVALVAYFSISQTFQLGMLGTWQHSFAGKAERSPVHAASFQPMMMWQLGKGNYLRSTGIMVFDFIQDNYYIPLGIGIGKVFKGRKAIFNIFAEAQFTAWHYGTGIPKAQLFVGVNTQF